MRDERTQALGAFANQNVNSKGSLIQHEKLIAFIQRNYTSDAQGNWYFQNGPQRVYIELEATPWVWRISDTFAITGHDGQDAKYVQAYVDEKGWLYFETHLGFGLVHTQDVQYAAAALEQGLWSTKEILRDTIANRFHFCNSPMLAHSKVLSA
jgi:hypothetical protein